MSEMSNCRSPVSFRVVGKARQRPTTPRRFGCVNHSIITPSRITPSRPKPRSLGTVESALASSRPKPRSLVKVEPEPRSVVTEPAPAPCRPKPRSRVKLDSLLALLKQQLTLNSKDPHSFRRVGTLGIDPIRYATECRSNIIHWRPDIIVRFIISTKLSLRDCPKELLILGDEYLTRLTLMMEYLSASGQALGDLFSRPSAEKVVENGSIELARDILPSDSQPVADKILYISEAKEAAFRYANKMIKAYCRQHKSLDRKHKRRQAAKKRFPTQQLWLTHNAGPRQPRQKVKSTSPHNTQPWR